VRISLPESGTTLTKSNATFDFSSSTNPKFFPQQVQICDKGPAVDEFEGRGTA
jgi:hypothetical protein